MEVSSCENHRKGEFSVSMDLKFKAVQDQKIYGSKLATEGAHKAVIVTFCINPSLSFGSGV